jgi:hypothetical protein
MKFQPGDKVKFLNEKGGGIVNRIIDSSTVEVSIEEGFDIPVLITELLKVPQESQAEKFFDVRYHIEPKPEQPPPMPRESAFGDPREALKAEAGIYWAYRPLNQKMLLAGKVELVLVNHTRFDVLYNLYRRTATGFSGADYGSIGPESTVMIDTVDREYLNQWNDCVLQFLFHAEELPVMLSPLEQMLRVKMSRLDKEDNYVDTPFLQGKAFVLQVYKVQIPGVEAEQKVLEIKPGGDTQLIRKHIMGDGFAEVDLHIHSLVENAGGLHAGQKMDIQIDYFRRSLESAIAAGLEKVVFIHGVGAGVLKIELKKILEMYDFIEFYDAAIARYGIGATEVLIHRQK